MYKVVISKTFKKKFDKLPTNIRERAKKLILQLETELIGEALLGDLKGLYSIHFERNKYRIIYTKNKNSIEIILLHIGKRNNSFYDTFRKN
jgi:addiction module RelE/StbE family toxin